MIRTFLRRLLSKEEPRRLPVGARAPEFEATDHRGEAVRLADLAGKRVVLWFYPKADTPG